MTRRVSIDSPFTTDNVAASIENCLQSYNFFSAPEEVNWPVIYEEGTWGPDWDDCTPGAYFVMECQQVWPGGTKKQQILLAVNPGTDVVPLNLSDESGVLSIYPKGCLFCYMPDGLFDENGGNPTILKGVGDCEKFWLDIGAFQSYLFLTAPFGVGVPTFPTGYTWPPEWPWGAGTGPGALPASGWPVAWGAGQWPPEYWPPYYENPTPVDPMGVAPADWPIGWAWPPALLAPADWPSTLTWPPAEWSATLQTIQPSIYDAAYLSLVSCETSQFSVVRFHHSEECLPGDWPPAAQPSDFPSAWMTGPVWPDDIDPTPPTGFDDAWPPTEWPWPPKWAQCLYIGAFDPVETAMDRPCLLFNCALLMDSRYPEKAGGGSGLKFDPGGGMPAMFTLSTDHTTWQSGTTGCASFAQEGLFYVPKSYLAKYVELPIYLISGSDLFNLYIYGKLLDFRIADPAIPAWSALGDRYAVRGGVTVPWVEVT